MVTLGILAQEVLLLAEFTKVLLLRKYNKYGANKSFLVSIGKISVDAIQSNSASNTLFKYGLNFPYKTIHFLKYTLLLLIFSHIVGRKSIIFQECDSIFSNPI